MRTIRKFMFYVSSFFPLYVLLFIQNVQIYDSKGNRMSLGDFFNQFYSSTESVNFFWIGLSGLLILSLFGVFVFFKTFNKSEGRDGTLLDVEFIREDTMGYVITYIVPLLSMDIHSSRSLLINFLLFLIIGSFYIKNDQIFMNPLYNAFGFNVFSAGEKIYITKMKKHEVRLFARSQQKVRLHNIIGDIYLVKKKKKEKRSEDLYI